MLVSEMEKKPDIGQQQQHEAAERPAQRRAPAPAVEVPADEQRAERQPGQDGEHRLVIEAQRPSEQAFREQDSRHEGEREEAEGEGDDPEQQPLQREQRRQARQRSLERPGRVLRCGAVRHMVQAPLAEHQRLDALEVVKEILDPVHRNAEPEHDRQRLRESKAHGRREQQRLDQRPAVQRERQQDRGAFPRLEFCRGLARRAPARVPEVQCKPGVRGGCGAVH
jgi:hypothetical protein